MMYDCHMSHPSDVSRYARMVYRKAGDNGLKLPVVSLGLWHNFGAEADPLVCRDIVATAFDHGITHFDLADNYGPPPGAAECRFGEILRTTLASHRDELVVSSKAGYQMWPGPYGDWGSRKHIIAGCDQSLKRLGLDYVDIFYHHRPDPNTPLEETMGALASLVRSGKALYVGISNYHAAEAVKAIRILNDMGCPCVLDQVRYSMLDRWTEKDHLFSALGGKTGVICFSPLAQGLLTDTYLSGTIPAGSRAKENGSLKAERITHSLVVRLNKLDAIAKKRGQSLSQMAVSWLLRNEGVTSVLVGARNPQQLLQILECVETNPSFSAEELNMIDEITEA